MIALHAHPADVAPRFVGFRGQRCCTTLLLSLAFLCLSAALSAHAVTTSRTPIMVKSPEPLGSPMASGAAMEAMNIPAYRPTLQRGTLLVASRYLADPTFAKAVVLLVDYGAHGAMGLIINRPTRTRLAKVFPGITPLFSRQDKLYLGGPVAQERLGLLLRTDRHLKEAAHVFANIFFSSASEDTLKRLLSGSEQGENFHAYRGHAGWGPGQLEDEVSRGDWHLVSPDSRIVFDAEPSEIWHELLRQSAGLWVQRGDHRFLSGYAP